MGAVRTTTLAALRRRRLQSVVIALVLLLATGAATLGLSVLVASHQPFDRAFTAANGAHLVLRFNGDVDRAALEATAHASTVTAAAGPWPVTAGAMAHPKGGLVMGAVFSARPTPDASIDAITMIAGRWWQVPGEAVLDASTARLLNKAVGDTIDVYPPLIETKGAQDTAPPPRPPAHKLTVVGIAQSVSTPDVAVWMSPDDVATLLPAGATGSPDLEMLYRVTPSATAADLGAATASIVNSLPADAVTGSQTYLDLRASADRLADLYVPVLLAFSVFALLAAAFMIANVVSGVVLTSYRDIGVMKAIGFTPRQVSAVLVGETFTPAAVGSVAGVVLGTIGSRPVIADTASSFGVPPAYDASIEVGAAVVALAFAIAILAAVGPAVRAGRLSAVTAMTRGVAPSAHASGGRLRRAGLALPLALPMRLGISAGLAHPGRAAMTLGALVVGVAAATFSLGLNASLLRVVNDIDRSVAAPVRAEVMDGGADTAPLSAAIAALPGTGRFVAVGEAEVSVPGMAPVPFVGYDGDSAWLGYAIISGRWFAGPGEVVAPTNFLTQSGLHVGDTFALTLDGRSVQVRLVGEIFDTERDEDNGLLLRGTWSDLAALQPSAQAGRWEAVPAQGVDAHAYESALQDVIGSRAQVYVEGDSSSDDSFLLFLSVVGLLGGVLVVISLGGVFNTVLLETRQRTREVAVLKTIGLTPRQVVGMVIATVVPAGLVAGVVGVPIGLAAQRLVLTTMGQVAAKTNIPPQEFDVFPPLAFLGLALLGLVIGAVGAWLPAQRAARARIAPVLQAE
jgi:putative ABC transport system permease protein